jgi:hypothetical protein
MSSGNLVGTTGALAKASSRVNPMQGYVMQPGGVQKTGVQPRKTSGGSVSSQGSYLSQSSQGKRSKRKSMLKTVPERGGTSRLSEVK